MNKKPLLIGVAVAALLTLAGYGFYQLGAQRGHSSAQTTARQDPANWGIPEGESATRRHLHAGLKAGDVDPVTGQEILYYHDPMVPGKKFDAPGKSPYMDMMLVPAYGSAQTQDTGSVTISSRAQQNFGMRTGEVVRREVTPEVSAVGTVTWNERTEVTLQARATGFVEKLHVRAALDRVQRGQPLLDLYVPDWVAVQEEYLALRHMSGENLGELVSAARQRMRQAGMTEAQIEQVERTGALQIRLQVTAPLDGVVTELPVREGSTVMSGAPLMRINQLATVWAEAAVPEGQSFLLNAGSAVTAVAPALPDDTFTGEVETLLPTVDLLTRTRRARIEIANPDGKLVPGMLVEMTLRALDSRSVMMVPTEALIYTGERTLVMLADEEGSFRAARVVAGMEAGGYTEVKGLEEGQKVVLSGQFLLDSEASLRGIEAQEPPAAPLNDGETHGSHGGQAGDHAHHHTETEQPTGSAVAVYTVLAEVRSRSGNTLKLHHDEISELGWPAMTMGFELVEELADEEIPVGQPIEIDFRLPEEGPPQILGWRPAGETR